MWKRRTWHECADELNDISLRFGMIWWSKPGYPKRSTPEGQRILEELSKDGVELLRAISLSVRSEQDFNLTSQSSDQIGFEKKIQSLEDGEGMFSEIARSGAPWEQPYNDFRPIDLRRALNKIAHAHPEKAGFRVHTIFQRIHDVLLVGENRGDYWIAAISILKLINAVKSIEDRNV